MYESEEQVVTQHGDPTDIDHFKQVNDEYGHLAGDHVLAELRPSFGARVRREDCCARYGGEEFEVATSESGMTAAVLFAEKLRGAISRQ